MKTPLFNLIKALLIFAIMFIATIYKFSRRHYRRFCIKVLWKKFHIRTSVYHQWHDRRAKKMQLALNAEHQVINTPTISLLHSSELSEIPRY